MNEKQMFRDAMVGLVLIVSVWLTRATLGDINEAAREASKRCVMVHAEEAVASGVVWTCLGNKARVLTVFHIVQPGEFLGVNHVVAKIIKADPKRDLMLLEVDFDCPQSITQPFLAKAEVLDQVVYAGNPAGVLGALSLGHVVALDNSWVYTDTLAIGGASGAGVYNNKGQLIGLNDQVKTSEPARAYITVAINADIIKAFLK